MFLEISIFEVSILRHLEIHAFPEMPMQRAIIYLTSSFFVFDTLTCEKGIPGNALANIQDTAIFPLPFLLHEFADLEFTLLVTPRICSMD